MNFVDLIKNSVINEFTGTISVDKIVFSLITSFLIGIFIIYIYKKTNLLLNKNTIVSSPNHKKKKKFPKWE